MDIVDVMCEDDTARVGRDRFGQLVLSRTTDGARVDTMICDVRGLECPICGHGWDVTPKSMANQFYHNDRKRWMHETCWLGVVAHDEHQRFFHAIIAAGLRFSGLGEIPNEYGGAWNTPWYETDLIDHPGVRLKMGRRKRVDEIVLTGINLTGHDLFAHEDVTKAIEPSCVMIHAHDDFKLREYMVDLANALAFEKEDGEDLAHRTQEKSAP